MQNPVGGPLTFKVRGAETGGVLTVLESEIAAGDGPPYHVHAHEDETLYVLDGSFRFRLGDDVRAAPVGSFVHVPRGLPHCFQNVGDDAGRLLVTFTPAGMERFFERFAESSRHSRARPRRSNWPVLERARRSSEHLSPFRVQASI